jgi:hypothetical protein
MSGLASESSFSLVSRKGCARPGAMQQAPPRQQPLKTNFRISRTIHISRHGRQQQLSHQQPYQQLQPLQEETWQSPERSSSLRRLQQQQQSPQPQQQPSKQPSKKQPSQQQFLQHQPPPLRASAAAALAGSSSVCNSSSKSSLYPEQQSLICLDSLCSSSSGLYSSRTSAAQPLPAPASRRAPLRCASAGRPLAALSALAASAAVWQQQLLQLQLQQQQQQL